MTVLNLSHVVICKTESITRSRQNNSQLSGYKHIATNFKDTSDKPKLSTGSVLNTAGQYVKKYLSLVYNYRQGLSTGVKIHNAGIP